MSFFTSVLLLSSEAAPAPAASLAGFWPFFEPDLMLDFFSILGRLRTPVIVNIKDRYCAIYLVCLQKNMKAILEKILRQCVTVWKVAQKNFLKCVISQRVIFENFQGSKYSI